MTDETRECAVCGDGCGLTVTYHWQDEEFDYCLDCAPEAIADYREQVTA